MFQYFPCFMNVHRLSNVYVQAHTIQLRMFKKNIRSTDIVCMSSDAGCHRDRFGFRHYDKGPFILQGLNLVVMSY